MIGTWTVSACPAANGTLLDAAWRGGATPPETPFKSHRVPGPSVVQQSGRSSGVPFPSDAAVGNKSATLMSGAAVF